MVFEMEQKPAPSLSHQNIESATSIGCVWKILLSTVDGMYALILSAIFLAMGAWELVDGLRTKTELNWDWLLVTFFIPILFMVIFVRHRIGTSLLETKPIVFSIISNTSIAIALIYYHWR
jgi:hypothetical protein